MRLNLIVFNPVVIKYFAWKFFAMVQRSGSFQRNRQNNKRTACWNRKIFKRMIHSNACLWRNETQEKIPWVQLNVHFLWFPVAILVSAYCNQMCFWQSYNTDLVTRRRQLFETMMQTLQIFCEIFLMQSKKYKVKWFAGISQLNWVNLGKNEHFLRQNKKFHLCYAISK